MIYMNEPQAFPYDEAPGLKSVALQRLFESHTSVDNGFAYQFEEL